MVKVLGNGTELQIKTCQPLPRVAGPLPAHGQPRALCWRLAPRPASLPPDRPPWPSGRPPVEEAGHVLYLFSGLIFVLLNPHIQMNAKEY